MDDEWLNLNPNIPGNLRRMFPELFSQPPPAPDPNPFTNLQREYLLGGNNFQTDPAFNYLLQTAQWQSFNISNTMGVILKAFFETLRNMVMERRAERADFRRSLDLRARRSTEEEQFSWFRKMR